VSNRFLGTFISYYFPGMDFCRFLAPLRRGILLEIGAMYFGLCVFFSCLFLLVLPGFVCEIGGSGTILIVGIYVEV
jgi:hypothetical protein